MTNQVAFSLLDARNLRLVDLGDGTFALATALLQDDTGGGGIAGTVNIEINDQVPALVDTNKLIQVPYVFNGSTYDVWRNNHEVTVLPSAARTTTTNSADQQNYNARGIAIVIDVTAHTGSASITITIQAKVGGVYSTLLSLGPLSSVSSTLGTIYPGITGGIGTWMSSPLPLFWRVTVTHATADSITYSVIASYLL